MKTWTNIDKSDWKEGEWKNEPDKAQWVSSGLDCLIVRGPSGSLCGYVGVPKQHSLFEKDYNSVYESLDVDVHGGLTFAGLCSPSPDVDHKGVCHIEEGAANKIVWWLGFDCAHAWDISPTYDYSFDHDSSYKNIDYVKNEVDNLAKQLAA